MDKIGSGSYPVAGCDIYGIELQGSATGVS